MANLKALLFDVDGTLADTERHGHRVAFNRAFQDAGLDWNWTEDLYEQLLSITGGRERIRYYIEKYLQNSPVSPDDAKTIATLHQAKTRHYLDMLDKGTIPLRRGVRTLLEEARSAGLHLAIATTTTPENVTGLLENTLGKEAPGWFSVIAAGDSVPAKKPAPDIYQLALQKLGIEAGNGMAFEDSRNGLLAAQGAGLATIITVNGYTRHEDFSGAAVVLDSMGTPQMPFNVLQGDAGPHKNLTLDAVHHLFARQQEQTGG